MSPSSQCPNCGSFRRTAVLGGSAERVAQAISDAGLFRGTALGLAGIGPDKWKLRAKTNRWRPGEIEAIAEVLGPLLKRQPEELAEELK